MKIQEYRNLNKGELKTTLINLKMELMKAGVGLGLAKVGKKKEKGTSGSDIKKRIRREIARVETVLSEIRNEKRREEVQNN